MRTVFITGASSGIGLATTHLLAQSGWQVFAGTYPGETPPQGEHIYSIALDITDRAMIDAAITQIKSQAGDTGLNALINNAGIVKIAPLEHITSENLRQQFEVNVFGTVQVTQACLPLLKQVAGARIINTLSIQAQLAIPLTGTYSMTKHALVAFAQALRMELAPWQIDVISVEPGVVKTPMSTVMHQQADTIQKTLPDNSYDNLFTAMRNVWHDSEKSAVTPEAVAQVIQKALIAENPRAHYPVGTQQQLLSIMANLMPKRRLEQAIMRQMKLPN
ncbi:MAG: SDR family NAD(P)-dependent oxidoreductase [Aggregatilineales bacterium]